jgi:hypothetical protein
MTDEFYITEVYLPSSDFSEIAWASYDISITTGGASAELAAKAQQLLTTSPLMMIKKGKAGEKEVDIVKMISSLTASFDESTGNINIKATVRASSTEYLNPEFLITALKNDLSILSGDPKSEYYSIMRTATLKEDMTEFR